MAMVSETPTINGASAGAAAPSVQQLAEELAQVREAKRAVAEDLETLQTEIRKIEQRLGDLDEQDLADGVEDDQVTAVLKAARKAFNEKAKKGVAMVVEAQVIVHEPRPVAKFLFETEGLSKTQIGEYLGENEPFNLEVLDEFATMHDFTSMSFDKALRAYLWSFRLPGESQKIDRMMEVFAKRFCSLNQASFTNSDTCYILAFSIIMLNTSLHNPNIKQKPTPESFVSMNRGIDNGKDLPEKLLRELYESINRTPFRIPDEEAGLTYTFFNPERNGWLMKEGGSHKSWKKRWFTLCNNCLYYFENEGDIKPKGTIPLENLRVQKYSKKANCFEIVADDAGGDDQKSVKAAKLNSKGQLVQGKHSSYKIQAHDASEMDEWMKCIQAAMMKDPVYELYRSRKENLGNVI